MSTKSYQDAINTLNTLQSNAATIAAIRATGILSNESAIAEMNEFVARIGLTVLPFISNRIPLSHLSHLSQTTSTTSMSFISPVPRAKDRPALSRTQSSDMQGPEAKSVCFPSHYNSSLRNRRRSLHLSPSCRCPRTDQGQWPSLIRGTVFKILFPSLGKTRG